MRRKHKKNPMHPHTLLEAGGKGLKKEMQKAVEGKKRRRVASILG